MNTDTTITPYLFGESTIRTTLFDSKPWFVAKDVCDCLGLGNVSQAVNGNAKAGALGLDEDEKGITNLDTLGGTQEILIVNESGLYALVFKSRKPEARAFRKWVTSEVLPAIRKHGAYGKRSQETLAFVRELLSMGLSSRDATRLTLHTYAPFTARQALKEEQEQEIHLPTEEQIEMEKLLTALLATGETDFRFADITRICWKKGIFSRYMQGEVREREDGNDDFILHPSERKTFSRILSQDFADRLFTLDNGAKVIWSAYGQNRGRHYRLTTATSTTA
ncbi:MAG: Bro-N domain-containing protein [Verrucomicrobiae bacterium]|nr:Bro-N domain-containing protein [Verrucomicrobiae bacterium]